MLFKVTLNVNVDVDGWQVEYGNTSAAQALKQVLGDLREPAHYLASEKWRDLATVDKVEAHIELSLRAAAG